MIAHVAAAGEQRGRVVLHLTHGATSSVALEAAMRVAQAFQSEIESQFVEDLQLIELAAFPFAREISLNGQRTVPLSPERIAEDMRHAASALHRQIRELARRSDVPYRATIVRDEPVRAVARACAECGPWNVVALAEPLGAGSGVLLRDLFAAVGGTTGVVVVGPNAKRTTGPVTVEVETITDVEPMLRAARRLLPVTGSTTITLLLVARSEAETMEMEDQARLVIGADGVTQIARATLAHGAPIELAERLRRSGSGFILARFGGLLVPADGDISHLTLALECPLFLMR